MFINLCYLVLNRFHLKKRLLCQQKFYPLQSLKLTPHSFVLQNKRVFGHAAKRPIWLDYRTLRPWLFFFERMCYRKCIFARMYQDEQLQKNWCHGVFKDTSVYFTVQNLLANCQLVKNQLQSVQIGELVCQSSVKLFVS